MVSTWLNDLSGAVTGTPTLSGGTEATSGGYDYHKFTSTGTLTVSAAGVAEVLFIAAGGGGGEDIGGGGGAGGMFHEEVVPLLAGSYTVTVGAGGSGAVGGVATNGADSTLAGLTAFGGGFGGRSGGAVGGDGGSGGGASRTRVDRS